MSDQKPKELLERAREAEADGAGAAARDLYQRTIDQAPYSTEAKQAGERLRELGEQGGGTGAGGTEGGTDDYAPGEAIQEAFSEKVPDIECPHCGSAEFVPGEVNQQGEMYGLTFEPEDADGGLLDVFLATGQAVAAYACTQCGNIELFAQMSEE